MKLCYRKCGWTVGSIQHSPYAAEKLGMYDGIGNGGNVGNGKSSYCFWSSRTSTLTATFLAALGGQISDASWRRFVLYLRFWNHIFTWVSVSFKAVARSALSGPDRYFWWPNLLSNSKTCWLEKAALDLFLRGLVCCCWFEVEVSLLSLSGASVLTNKKLESDYIN